jgi:hypothetical protein
MTEVNGLRLAYRGFVTGLAGAYVWLAIAMLASTVGLFDPVAPLRPIAALLVPAATTSAAMAFALGFVLVQLGGGLVGMVFAYFFGRFFTARPTLTIAAACFALLAWSLLAAGLVPLGVPDLGTRLAPLVASLAYGIMLGVGLPLRGDVLRTPGASA